ncbi:Tetraspanin-4-like [Arapaima gigas]
MRQTVPSIFLCLPTLLAFSSPHPNSATEESFSKRTALISQALTTAAKTEWPRLPNTSANSYPLNETTKQHNLNVSKRTVTTPSGYRVSEWSGVTGTVETRGGLAESKPWKDYVETPYTPLGERTTTAQSLDTILAGGTQPHEVTAVMDLSPPSDSPEVTDDSSHSASTPFMNYSSESENRTMAPASHSTASFPAGSTTERHNYAYTQSHASANTHHKQAVYDMATKTYDREIGQTTEIDNKTDLCNQEGNNTITGESQPECGKREVKLLPMSNSTKLFCFVTLWTLGVTASVFFGITVFLWVRLSVQREKRQRTEAVSDQGALWTQPGETLEERVEFWYANRSLVAPEQSQRSPQPPGDEQRRTESETLWIQPRVTLKDITEFWYANRRTRWDMESSEV